MIAPFVKRLIKFSTKPLFNDEHPSVMWVDFHEGDDDIISMAAEALSPVFENDQLYVRYIKASKGGDTLAFMRLTDYTILQRIQASSLNP